MCVVDPDGCTIGTACVADGDASPLNPCEVCDIATSRTEYSPEAAGITCDDGFFCTEADVCDGAGGCGGTAIDCSDGLDCTTDTCDEDADACMSTPSPPGTRCGADPMCLDGFIIPAPTCDAAGVCVPGERRPCIGPDGAPCDPADPRMCLGGGCRDDSECILGLRCVEGACVPEDTGEPCTEDADCAGGFCTDGVCCDRSCDGVCEGCSIFGICSAHPAGTDPEDECVLACRGTSACEEPDAGAGTDAGDDDGGGDADAGTGGTPRGSGGCCSVAPGADRDGERTGAIVLLGLLAVLALYRMRRR
jgi:hypothetical protein